ncbi:MAG TPA: VOC family protein [Saprospiraceae bacterium]|nr:VOC family protein [Saprospiraceae bacterium]
MSNQHLAHIALVVDDYDEAIDFYVNKLGFELVEDIILDDQKRWVIVSPKGKGSCSLLLAKAVGDEQKSRVGNQTGGRVFLFLYTDDFEDDYLRLMHHNIKIIRPRRQEAYGEVLVFEDLYGNLWDLIKPI